MQILQFLLLVGYAGSGGAAAVGLMHWNRDRQAAVMLISLPFCYALSFALVFFMDNARINKIVTNLNNDIIENVNNNDSVVSKIDFKVSRISNNTDKIELNEGDTLCDYFVDKIKKDNHNIYETQEKHIKYSIQDIVINKGKGCSKNNSQNNIQYTLRRN